MREFRAGGCCPINVLISCLGLYGLASFTAERRTQEIGIRKVLGASVLMIVMLLSGEFTKILLMATAIALPISYLMANEWLERFAYRISFSEWYFVIDRDEIVTTKRDRPFEAVSSVLYSIHFIL